MVDKITDTTTAVHHIILFCHVLFRMAKKKPQRRKSKARLPGDYSNIAAVTDYDYAALPPGLYDVTEQNVSSKQRTGQ